MKFKIDPKYKAFQCLEALIGFSIGYLIIYLFSYNSVSEDLIFSMGLLLFIFCLLVFFQRKITLSEGQLIFKQSVFFRSTCLKIHDIASATISKKFFTKLIVTTTCGDKYILHPEKAESLKTALMQMSSSPDK